MGGGSLAVLDPVTSGHQPQLLPWQYSLAVSTAPISRQPHCLSSTKPHCLSSTRAPAHLPQEDASTLQQCAWCRPPGAAVADVLHHHKAQHQQQLEALDNVLTGTRGQQDGRQVLAGPMMQSAGVALHFSISLCMPACLPACLLAHASHRCMTVRHTRLAFCTVPLAVCDLIVSTQPTQKHTRHTCSDQPCQGGSHGRLPRRPITQQANSCRRIHAAQQLEPPQEAPHSLHLLRLNKDTVITRAPPLPHNCGFEHHLHNIT